MSRNNNKKFEQKKNNKSINQDRKRRNSNKKREESGQNDITKEITKQLIEKGIEKDIEESLNYQEKKKKETQEMESLLPRTIFEEENMNQPFLLNNQKGDVKKEVWKQVSEESPKRKRINLKEKISRFRNVYFMIDIVLFLACILFFFLLISITPKIYMIGESKIKIEYGTDYKDLGATAKYLGKDYSGQIKIENEVNSDKVGTYYVTYTLKNASFQLVKQRIVEVVDVKPPVIELTGSPQVKICPNGDYQEEGVSAFDEYDGDLTNQIKIKRKKNQIIYSVEDSSHNVIEKYREIKEIDEEAPILTLKGSEKIYVNLDGEYQEPGYQAMDNCDGDITSQVVVEGSVNSHKIGTYSLTYHVKDQSGLESSKVRDVIVSQRTDPESGNLKTGAIYLTFDDGPNEGTTNKILDVLKSEGVKATFFVTCNGPDYLIQREFQEGHSIALHTATHNYSYVYQSEANYFEDLKRVSDRVKRIIGRESKLIRFPGGSSNTVSKHYNQGIMTRLTEEVLERGYHYYDWNVDASDAWQCAKANVTNKKECVYQNVTKNLYKNRANIVLMHDVKAHTADALLDIIRFGKQNGYTFEVIDTGTKMVRFKVNN